MERKGNTDTNIFSKGTIIVKYWNGLPYRGIVTSNTGKYYKISYEEEHRRRKNDRRDRTPDEIDKATRQLAHTSQ